MVSDIEIRIFLDQYKNGQISIHKFIHKLTGINPEIKRGCLWGSHLYTTMMTMFGALICLDKFGYNAEKEMGFIEFPKPEGSPQEVSHSIREEALKSPYTDYYGKNLDESFQVDLKGRMCYNLWNSIIRVMQGIYTNYVDLNEMLEVCLFSYANCVDFPPLYGRHSRYEFEIHNYAFGLVCFQLVKHGYVKNFYRAFSGFPVGR